MNKINKQDSVEILTEDHLNMLQYFWQEKGDLEGYVFFDRLKPALKEGRPEVLKAWDDYKVSILILDKIMSDIYFMT